jgi:hypothetical protein
MNRRCMILVPVVVAILALPCSAADYDLTRLSPTDSPSVVLALMPNTISPPPPDRIALLEFHALFTLNWGYGWHEAQWWMNDTLIATDNNLGANKGITVCTMAWSEPGTYQVKVRAKYDSIPFGVHVWTSYLTWTVTVIDPQAYTIERTNPVEASCSVPANVNLIEPFKGRFGGIPAPAQWAEAQWYVDGALQKTQALSGQTAESFYYPSFDKVGTHKVEVRARYDLSFGSVWTDYLTWTVNVVPHPPTASRVSPDSPVAVPAGVSQAFTVRGSDPGSGMDGVNIAFVRWYLDGAEQGDFQVGPQPVSETIEHTWRHTFRSGGTYQVEAICYDTDGYASAGGKAAWTVVVEDPLSRAALTGLVIALDAQGQPQGPLPGAKVDLAGPTTATATTDGQGRFAFTGLNPGTCSVNVSKTGYYTQSRSVSLAPGETQNQTFRLMPEASGPAVFDFESPCGKFFIEGLPENLSFSAEVEWNGPPGSVHFNVAGNWQEATILDRGAGKAEATLTIPAPDTISQCTVLQVEVKNGEGKTSSVSEEVYFLALPRIIDLWYTEWPTLIASEGEWLRTERAQFTLWDWNWQAGKNIVACKAGGGMQKELHFDPRDGKFHFLTGLSAMFNLSAPVNTAVNVLGDCRLDLAGVVDIVPVECDTVQVTGGWKLSLTGKGGIEAPVVTAANLIPGAGPVVAVLQGTPLVGNLVNAMKVRIYLIVGGALKGQYENGFGDCFLGTTSVSGSFTLGLEGQVLVSVKWWGKKLEAGVYAGVTGTPEWQFCPEPVPPDERFKGCTFRGYVGWFACAGFFRYSREVGVTWRVGGDDAGQKITALSALPGLDQGGSWQPIGDSCLRWGPMNVLAAENSSSGRLRILSVQGEFSEETRLMENVVSTASPVLLSGASERVVLFSLYDPNKPWYAATDIGTLHQTGNQAWKLDQVTDDQAAEFGPSVVATGSGTALATWERVSGDVSDANDPDQVAPHMEIVAAWFDPTTGLWSTPQQLTSNALADEQPVPIALDAMRGILWIQNEGTAAVGDANFASRLMFAKWSGSTWDEPQVLWSANKGLLDFAFVANGLGEGHVVLAVDEDGDPNTTADCELYLLSTANGAWQPATQLTSDSVEDTMPTLVAPDGVPICVWSADKKLVYSPLDDWNPREVYKEYTPANEAPSLDAVTMPGGAAIAYTVQGPNGVDVVASFYDPELDCWSLPRQLTNDEHAETSLSLACDGGELVVAYLKTQTERTGKDVEINGEMVHLDSVPQPGRTDLYVLRHALANDLAVISDSVVVEPANPVPGTTATIRATVENRGDLPLQNVDVVFYDGDPSQGGVAIANRQVIAGTFIAGGKQDVSISWKVPQSQSAHEIFVAVDPSLAVEDRDRSNNVLSARTVLPDLSIETCWSTEVSPTSVASTVRVVNKGVIPAGGCMVSWRRGAADGEQIGTSTIQALIAGGVYEATFIWDTTGLPESGQTAQVFAVVDAAGSVPEFDETNNVSSLAVFHPPARTP